MRQASGPHGFTMVFVFPGLLSRAVSTASQVSHSHLALQCSGTLGVMLLLLELWPPLRMMCGLISSNTSVSLIFLRCGQRKWWQRIHMNCLLCFKFAPRGRVSNSCWLRSGAGGVGWAASTFLRGGASLGFLPSIHPPMVPEARACYL
jgi:hypothetical protein